MTDTRVLKNHKMPSKYNLCATVRNIFQTIHTYLKNMGLSKNK